MVGPAEEIQSRAASPVRFSKGRIATRSTTGLRLREQAPQTAAATSSARLPLFTSLASEDLVLRGENLLELHVVLQTGEFRFGLELIPVLEAAFQRFAYILQSPVRHASFRAGLGQHIEVTGAFLDGAFLDQN